MTTIIEFTPGRYCPIVGGLARRFAREDFAGACDTLRDLAREKNQDIYDYCLECGAEIPEAVEFIAINRAVIEQALTEATLEPGPQRAELLKPLKIQETITMEKKETKKQPVEVCELCDRERKLKKHFGKYVCTSCQFIMTEAKNRPETLRDVLENAGEMLPSKPVELQAEEIKLPPNLEFRMKRLENMAKRIEALAGLAGLLSCDTDLAAAEDVLHRSVKRAKRETNRIQQRTNR